MQVSELSERSERAGRLTSGSSAAVAGAADQEFIVTEAILDLVDRWCTAGSVVLIMDDLQWADPSSLVVLSRLGRAIDQLPLLVVAAYRPIPRGEEFDTLIRGLDARGAVPLYITELVDALTREGRLRIVAVTATLVEGRNVPDSLVEAILRRLAFVSSEARE